MAKIVANLRCRKSKRALYRRTLNELNQLSEREAADLGICRAEFRQLAWSSVYGA